MYAVPDLSPAAVAFRKFAENPFKFETFDAPASVLG